jgi:hypothetical protein
MPTAQCALSGFRVELPVDEDGIVVDDAGLFRRVIDDR